MKKAEPLMLNPNNYTNVGNILINLKETTDTGKSLQWIFLGYYKQYYWLAERVANDNPTKFSFASSGPELHHQNPCECKDLQDLLGLAFAGLQDHKTLHLQGFQAAEFSILKHSKL